MAELERRAKVSGAPALALEARIWVELGPGEAGRRPPARFAVRASAPVTVAARLRLEEKTQAGSLAPAAQRSISSMR